MQWTTLKISLLFCSFHVSLPNSLCIIMVLAHNNDGASSLEKEKEIPSLLQCLSVLLSLYNNGCQLIIKENFNLSLSLSLSLKCTWTTTPLMFSSRSIQLYLVMCPNGLLKPCPKKFLPFIFNVAYR